MEKVWYHLISFYVDTAKQYEIYQLLPDISTQNI